MIAFQIGQLDKTVDKKALGTETWPGKINHVFKKNENSPNIHTKSAPTCYMGISDHRINTT